MQYLQSSVSGSRVIVYGGRAKGYGHFFDGVNQGGTVRFLDGQAGGVAVWTGQGYTTIYYLPTTLWQALAG